MEDGRTRDAAGIRAAKSRIAVELQGRYDALLQSKRVQWTTYHYFERELGRGGQGIVYLSVRKGADGFTQPVAMKVFSPDRFATAEMYAAAMERIARVASRIAMIQHDNLLSVQDFVDQNRIRIMVMEWVDGIDLRQLVNPDRLDLIQKLTEPERWAYIERVIATRGPEQTRFKAGVAVAVVRDCLAALAALHRHGIVHGDIKPANIMLKKTGAAKLIDMGSAFEMDHPPATRACTPAYAAPEVLEGAHSTPQSDLASVGYVLIEMLAGRSCFPSEADYQELLEAKRSLPARLAEVLPPDVSCNDHLMNFCRRLIAPDPTKRFPSAEAAELLQGGAAEFHRQLVFGHLASEYTNDIRVLLEEVFRIEALAVPDSSESGSSSSWTLPPTV
ncbi:MAG: serine/threonine protein kinase [Pirellulaceae bacterium]|nr:MAG: serine/threonine protein kinase [Pirellulaceae bacterium]